MLYRLSYASRWKQVHSGTILPDPNLKSRDNYLSYHKGYLGATDWVPLSAIFSVSWRCIHVAHCALWPDSGELRAGGRSSAARDQKEHDRQAPEADRPSRKEESQNSLPTGTLLRSLFLRRTGCPLVRPHRARSRGSNDQIDAEDRSPARHGDRGSDL